MIVVVSWFLYRYLAPRTWKEWASAGIVHWPTIFSIALFPIIVVAYYLLARSEERKVEEEFGDAYRVYRTRVPMFIPRWGQWRAMTINTSKSE